MVGSIPCRSISRGLWFWSLRKMFAAIQITRFFGLIIMKYACGCPNQALFRTHHFEKCSRLSKSRALLDTSLPNILADVRITRSFGLIISENVRGCPIHALFRTHHFEIYSPLSESSALSDSSFRNILAAVRITSSFGYIYLKT